jgi:glycosyltransferase involved in cell wall biosynthesis
MTLSIVIPCYNEADNLVELFKSIDPICSKYSNIEILLVDNGSTDHSAQIFKSELQKRNTNVFKLIKVEKNIGYGFGILSGLRAANGEILSVTHADRQTDPFDVIKAFDIYLSQKNEMLLVKGYRKNRKITEAFFSWAMGVLSSIALGTRLTEINAQPKLFSKKFFNMIQQDAPHDFSLDLYFLYHAKRKGIILEFPVFFAKRVAGEAKGGSGSSWKTRWKLIKRIFKYIFELRKKVVNDSF